jgi:hypothetical protein
VCIFLGHFEGPCCTNFQFEACLREAGLEAFQSFSVIECWFMRSQHLVHLVPFHFEASPTLLKVLTMRTMLTVRVSYPGHTGVPMPNQLVVVA